MGSTFAYEYTTQTHLLVSDEDAGDFLQSQFTNELRPIQLGRCTYGLWLDIKGKVVADSYVLCEGEESFRLISETSDAAVLTEKLEKHIIADDVVIDPADPLTGFAILGEGVEAIVEELGFSLPARGQYAGNSELRVFAGRRSEQTNYEVLCLTDAAVGTVLEILNNKAVEMLDSNGVNLERIEAGFPLVPVDIGSGDMPGEGGLEQDAISFTKGCYLGQEVVARMHNVGRPQRTLFVVRGGGSVPECPIEVFNMDSKSVGSLRSAVETEAGWLGVALLKHRFVEVGDALKVDAVQLTVERRLRAEKGGAS
ncbi:MAG: YgfZ/GcvT domain-containing protein [Opitutaceae bacterium]